MELTQEKLKEILRYDPETGVFYWKVSVSQNTSAGSVAGCYNRFGYCTIRIDGVGYGAHCLAWLYTVGEFPLDELDHIDGNPSNNRFDNLREATNAENGRNRKLNSNNMSGFKGVCQAVNGRWQAQIGFNGRRIHLGYFSTAEEAHVSYESKAMELFGEFKRG